MLAEPALESQAHVGASRPRGATAPAQAVPQLWHLRASRGLCEATAVRLLARSGLRVVQRAWMAGAEGCGAPELLLVTAAAPEVLVQAALAGLRSATGAAVHCRPQPQGRALQAH